MSRLARLAVLLLAALLVALPPAACGGGAEGAVVFDGESLAGWEGDPAFWSVEDGCIVGRTTAADPLVRSTWLVWTGGELRDFDLALEFQLPRGNSGVQFRGRVVGEHAVAGYQVDLADDQALTGSLYEQFGRQSLVARGESLHVLPTGAVGERRRFASEEEIAAAVRPGAWNELRIRAVGPRAEVFVNGTRTVELVDEAGAAAALSGVLALQLHSGPPMEVRFRNFRLEDLGGVHDDRERTEARWIWTHPDPREGEEAWFRHVFELPGEPVGATLWAVADDAFEAYLNGRHVASGEGVAHRQEVDVVGDLRAGRNVLALWARNVDGTAAALAFLRVRGDGWVRDVFTGPDWQGARAEPPGWLEAGGDERWGPVHVWGPVGTEPWPRPSRSIKHARLTALPGDEVRVPQGFECELVYSVPRARQGSWVALCFDPAGRAYTSDQHGFLYRTTLDATGEVLRVERVDVPLGEAQGLCWAGDALYVVVNGSGRFASGLYRVTDSDDDDRLDRVEELRRFEGSGEHGLHAVVLGPDGLLYLVGGHEVAPPPEALAAWGPSFLPVGRLPVAVQRVEVSQFALTAAGATGWIARTDLDGKEWELVCVGLRNVYDLAFDRGGLTTFDSDMEWDLGLPWYVPTRFLRVPQGADFGFRLGSARWPTWFPDSAPALLELGRSSPTGLCGPRGLAFPASHAGAVFCGDWLQGRILAVFPGEDGGAPARHEVFAEGRPLPVTDLAVGPDGALWFTTGGRHGQSGLYRIRAAPGGRVTPSVLVPRAPDAVAVDAEALRGALRAEGPLAPAARLALERSVTDWRTRLAAEESERARRSLALSLARVGPPAEVSAWLEEAARRPLGLGDEEGARHVLRTLELALLRAAPVAAGTRVALAEALLAAFPTPWPELDRQVGVLLASLPEAARRFVPLALERLAASTGAEAFHWAFLLRHARAGWTPEGRVRYFRWLREAEVSFGGGREVPLFLEALRRDAVASLGADERAALGDLVERGVPEGVATTTDRPFVAMYTREDLEPELHRVDDPGRDLARGARLLKEVTCLACHRVDGRGRALGPELDGLGARFSAADLLESLLEPSREVPLRYRDTIVWLANGGLRVGQLQGEEDGALVLRTATGDLVRVPAGDVESLEESAVSPMPEGLLNVLEVEEILDLMAYLLR